MIKKIYLIIGVGIVFIFTTITISKAVFAPSKSVDVLGRSINYQVNLDEPNSFVLSHNRKLENLSAHSYLVLNLTTGDRVFAFRSDTPFSVASLTKLMTVWVAINYGTLTDTYTITNLDKTSIKPTLGLVVGDEVLIQDILYSILVGSANDASLAVSHYIENKTGLPFEELMNKEAVALGLQSTHFNNQTGFDSDINYSSSDDISKIIKKLITTNIFTVSAEAESYKFTSIKNYPYTITATNKLINSYSDLRAIKTGYTNTALGSMANLLLTDTHTYLIIVIGSNDREKDTLTLRKTILANIQP